MLKAYRHLYQKVEVLNAKGDGEEILWVINQSLYNGKPWWEQLIPSHRRFFDSLPDVDQLMLSLSCDPFNALHAEWKKRSRRS